MARLKIDDEGPFCPNCGGRQFHLRSMMRWNPGRSECVACGKAFDPVSKSDLKKRKRAD